MAVAPSQPILVRVETASRNRSCTVRGDIPPLAGLQMQPAGA